MTHRDAWELLDEFLDGALGAEARWLVAAQSAPLDTSMVSGFTTGKPWPTTSGTRLTLHRPMIPPWHYISRGTE